MPDPTRDDIVSVQPMTQRPANPIPWTWTTPEFEEQQRKDRVSRAWCQLLSGALWVGCAVLFTVKAAHPAALMLVWLAAISHVVLAGVLGWMVRRTR